MIKKMNKEEIQLATEDIDIEHKDRLISFLSLFKNGEYIYPSIVSKIIKKPMNDTLKLLKTLEKRGIIEVV